MNVYMRVFCVLECFFGAINVVILQSHLGLHVKFCSSYLGVVKGKTGIAPVRNFCSACRPRQL